MANAFEAASFALLLTLNPYAEMNGGALGTTAVRIAVAKVSLSFGQAFFAGILCNLLVCMAVWLTLAGRSIVNKLIAMVFPTSAFVAAGFEHSAANMYFIPLNIFLRDSIDAAAVAGIERMGYRDTCVISSPSP